MYAIVEFKNRECALVPLLWLHDQSCYWPKVKTEESFLKLVKNCLPPKLTWPTYTVEKTLYTGENFDVALKYLEKIIEDFSSEANASSASLTRKPLTEDHSDSSLDFDDDRISERAKKRKKGTSERESLKKKPKQSLENSSSDSEILISKRIVPSAEKEINPNRNNDSSSRSWSPESRTEIALEQHSEVNTPSSAFSTPPYRSDTPNINSEMPSTSRNITPINYLSTNIKNNMLNEKLITTLEQLKSNQDQHSIILNEILRTIKFQGNPVTRPDDLPNLPIDSKQDYKDMEQFLKDESKFSYLRSRLAAVGGATVRHVTMNMLKYLMTNRIAMKFNWAGRDKRPFKSTLMMKLINDAVKLAFCDRDATSDLKDTIIAGAVKDWLKLAKQRHGYALSKCEEANRQ